MNEMLRPVFGSLAVGDRVEIWRGPWAELLGTVTAQTIDGYFVRLDGEPVDQRFPETLLRIIEGESSP